MRPFAWPAEPTCSTVYSHTVATSCCAWHAKSAFRKETIAGMRHNGRDAPMIGIGGHLAMPPLPHHRAYGSVPRRFDWVKLGQRHGVGGDRVSRIVEIVEHEIA